MPEEWGSPSHWDSSSDFLDQSGGPCSLLHLTVKHMNHMKTLQKNLFEVTFFSECHALKIFHFFSSFLSLFCFPVGQNRVWTQNMRPIVWAPKSYSERTDPPVWPSAHTEKKAKLGGWSRAGGVGGGVVGFLVSGTRTDRQRESVIKKKKDQDVKGKTHTKLLEIPLQECGWPTNLLETSPILLNSHTSVWCWLLDSLCLRRLVLSWMK